MAQLKTKFLANNAVTNSKLATAPATTIKGNNTGSTANVTDLTSTQVTAMLNPFVGDSGSGGTQGLVPAPPAGSNAAFKFLSAGGSFTTVELDAYEASGSTATTTTSTTDVQLDSLTETPVAGTYLVIFSTTVTSNTANSTITVSLYSGGTQVAHSLRIVTPNFTGGLGSGNIPIPLTTNAIVTVNGSQVINVQWHITGGGTASCVYKSFDMIKIQ